MYKINDQKMKGQRKRYGGEGGRGDTVRGEGGGEAEKVEG